MVCQTCRAVGVQAGEAYKCRMTGEGKIYQEKQKGQVQCPECGKEIASWSLDIHHQNQNGVERGGEGQKDNKGARDRGNEPKKF